MSPLYLGNPPHSKCCSKCGVYKAFSEYRKSKRQKSGLSSRCKACLSKKKYRDYTDHFWKRFYARVIKVGDCLEWQGSFRNGYPFCVWQGKQQSLRRVVYRLVYGEVSEDEFVLVTCENKRCVRQGHLKKVTKYEFDTKRFNSMPVGECHWSHIRSDRMPFVNRNGVRIRPKTYHRGEQNKSSKLTENDVYAIRALSADGATQVALAAQFGVSRTLIRNIIRGKIWCHVHEP